MKYKTGLIVLASTRLLRVVLAGVLAVTAIPSMRMSIATPVKKQLQLTTGQREFFRQLDEAVGTKLLPVALSISAAPIVKAATLACGDTTLQRRVILALGGTTSQADHAIDRFESLFCNGKVAA